MRKTARTVVVVALAVVLGLVAVEVGRSLLRERREIAVVDPTETPRPDPGIKPGQLAVTGLMEGMIYAGAEQRAHYQATSSTQRQDGSIQFPDGVNFSLLMDGQQVDVKGASGEADGSRRYVKLTGGVTLRRADGVRLEADEVSHQGFEGWDRCDGHVWFAHGSSQGWAEHVEYRPELGILNMRERVRLVDTTPEATVTASGDTLDYRKADGWLSLRGLEVQLAAPDLLLRGQSVEGHLVKGHATDALLAAAGNREVEAVLTRSLVCDEDTKVIFVRGGVVTASFDELGKIRGIATMQRGSPTRASAQGAEGQPVWDLAAGGVTAEFDPASRQLKRVQTVRWTDFTRHPTRAGDAPIHLESGAADGVFRVESGALETATFTSGVTLDQGKTRLTGATAVYAKGGVSFTGEPKLSDDGMVLLAAEIRLARDGGVSAQGNVNARIDATRASSLAPGSAGDPVRVSAERMVTADGGRWIDFEGNARASRAEALLSADRIRMARGGGAFEATGQVKVVSTDAEGRRGVAMADKAVSRAASREVELGGGVVLAWPELEVRADEARIRLKPDGQSAEELVAWGKKVVTTAGDRVITSERVVYRPETGRATFTATDGNAEIVDGSGRRFSGDSLTVERGNDKIFVGSEVDGTARSVVRAEGSKP